MKIEAGHSPHLLFSFFFFPTISTTFIATNQNIDRIRERRQIHLLPYPLIFINNKPKTSNWETIETEENIKCPPKFPHPDEENIIWLSGEEIAKYNIMTSQNG